MVMETHANLKQIEKQNSAYSFIVKFLDMSELSRVVSAGERSRRAP